MTIHFREKIRKSFISLLDTDSNLPTVQSNRTTALSGSERPGIVVISGSEDVANNDFASKLSQKRTYTLAVSVQIEGLVDGAVQDTLDGHVLNIEKAVLGWDYLSSDVIRWDLTNVDQRITDDSSQILAEATLIYEFQYIASGRNPETT